MLVVGICGSPRQESTEYITKEALRMLEEKGFETKFFTVRGKQIQFCTHCDFCLSSQGECTFKDAMEEVYALLKEAQGIILATPVYNGTISGQMKALMDRTRAVVAADEHAFKGKIGMGIATGGDRMGGQEMALTQIHTFYILNEMIPVSGGPFGANLGATFWTNDTLEGAKKDEEGFRTLKKTVKRFAEYLNQCSVKSST
jgi:multimeric flavodoxin WrbA